MTFDVLELSRRRFLWAALAVPTVALTTARMHLIPTDPDDEGPFYKEGAPFREQLFTPGAKGTLLEITGRVISSNGEPIPQSVVDLWNANPQGVYDLQGFALRGKVKADSNGRFRILTLRPPPYGHRTAHLHFKVSGQDHRSVTTQLYFRGEARNYQDGYVRPARLVTVRTGKTQAVTYDFVLAGV
jgi:protocatechuate 3,4-dioxygenase beta subunit